MVKAEDYINKTKKRAQDLSEKQNLIFRLIRIDNEQFLPYPSVDDVRTDRICVEIDNTLVSKATIQ